MPTINIKVKDKIAHQTGNERYVCGNSDYVVEFDFDSEWDAFPQKTARFKYNGAYQDVLFSGSSCAMPVILGAAVIQIGVYAGDLHTTTPAVVQARKSILDGDGVPDDPPEDVYNQLMAMLNDILARLEALEKGEGGGDTPDEPDEPDVPVVQQLAKPVISLETVDTGGDDSGDTGDDSEYTPAILGVAILGRTILGKTDGDYEPTITQLTAPSIRIETVDDGEDEPVVPEVPQLTAPTIKLETVVYTLSAPEIELVEV